MRKQFLVRYFTRLAVLAPLLAILLFIPPGPWVAKTAGMTSLVLILLLVQLVELAVILRNEERAANDRDHPASKPGS